MFSHGLSPTAPPLVRLVPCEACQTVNVRKADASVGPGDAEYSELKWVWQKAILFAVALMLKAEPAG